MSSLVCVEIDGKAKGQRSRHARQRLCIGRICMNLCMIDLTDVPEARLEDDVVLLGSSVTSGSRPRRWENGPGTINCEIVARISPFLPRRVA